MQGCEDGEPLEFGESGCLEIPQKEPNRLMEVVNLVDDRLIGSQAREAGVRDATGMRRNIAPGLGMSDSDYCPFPPVTKVVSYQRLLEGRHQRRNRALVSRKENLRASSRIGEGSDDIPLAKLIKKTSKKQKPNTPVKKGMLTKSVQNLGGRNLSAKILRVGSKAKL
ncbi:hypothetical protein PIB30_016146 [Stylosanthes scabra]|uniref:Uncharacterized protein n=1 Tax=Stylosanthes scabra TaxID=79078 RepID=A0ABU6S6P1_9FABA|nr:hypothetical protein [Stylosanthes scabra]